MQKRYQQVLELNKIRDRMREYAVTELGKQAVTALEPTGDSSLVRQMQEETEEAFTIMAYNGGSPMIAYEDVRPSLKLAALGSTLSMKALLNIAEALRASRGVKNALVTDRQDTPHLKNMGVALYSNRALEEEIFNDILSEEEMSDHASPALADIRRHIRQVNERMREKLNALIRDPGKSKYLMDAIITMRNGRYVVPVKAECRANVPGLVHDQSGTGSTLFIEPMSVVEAGNDLKQWTAKEKQEMERILHELSARVAPDAEQLSGTVELLAQIDMIFARAALGRSMNGVQPKLNTEGRIRLKQARHPLIDPDKVVPSDLWLGQDFTTLVITGPNTGGKTVTLKTVGLFTLMAQCGMQIPAEYGSELAIFDEVYADIGDEQSIEQSLSTFSSHMTNIVSILDNVTPNSLVLFDELGAGTDPTEGAALAMSILEHLLHQGVRTMATTQYSELKAFALSTAGVENASVEFDVQSLRPTYRLSIGIPGKSNAFEISRKLGLPDFLIQNANERLTRDQIRFEDVIANAEYHRQIAEKERKLAEEAHLETQRLRNETEKARRELNEQRDVMLKKAKEDARRVLKKAQAESEQIITELKRAKNKSDIKEHELAAMRRQLQDAVDATAEQLQPSEAAQQAAPKTVKPGDTVVLLHLSNAKATVLTAPDAKGEVNVQAGLMKMKVSLKDMRLSAPDKPDKKAKRAAGSAKISVSARPVETEVDVRGMNVEEAILAVDMFIDGAVLNKLNIVQIIHGKGTGVLRSGVQDHLRRHPAVKEFRLGVYGEVEDGVTVVTLK